MLRTEWTPGPWADAPRKNLGVPTGLSLSDMRILIGGDKQA
jgi:hypothetical protein